MSVHVFTSAAANYLPKARALFQSLRRAQPNWRLHLAIADAPPSKALLGSVAPDELHLIADLGVPEWRAWTFCHSLIELATAIKPFVLKRLLARPDCEAAIYLDPDVFVFSPLDEVTQALARADIVLTPHQARPESTTQGVIAGEICTLQHGVYNLGFIGVANRPEGRALARWWAERTYRFCRADIPNGLFTDQRWIDLAPAFFERVEVLRTPRLNVAPWNLSARRLAGRAPRSLTVEGEPAGFVHFSAIDRGSSFGGDRAADALAAWYRKTTAPSGLDRREARPWAFDAFADGEPIRPEQRLVYRLRGDLQRAYPNPFASGDASFQGWWRGQAAIEFPALFDAATHDAEVARLASALTTGYVDLPEEGAALSPPAPAAA